MNHVENCVEDHVKYFKVCWKPYWKFQGLGHTAEKGMTWPWRDLLKTYFTELIQLKYKLILWIKTMGCCGLACVVWLKSCEFLEEKISLNCWQLQHDVPVTEIFEFNPPVNLLYFLSNWVNLSGIFNTCEKPRAFERNPSLWSSYFIPWRPIVYL